MTAGLATGSLVGGRYRIVRRLGLGGMGAVYLANVEGVAGFEKLVALKVAHSHISHDKQVMEMFLAEARLSAQLQHSNLGQVYDLGQSDELYFIAMEYIRGVDLRALINSLQGARLPVPIVLTVVCRLLEGLDYAHSMRDRSGKPLKLVHRDVSPVNCLISYTGDVKLIDFGIAKAVGQVSATQTGMVRGKLNYMSPEQARGRPLDRRSDVFAVGVILYELLVGQRPFDGPTDMDVMHNLIRGRCRRPRELDPEVSAELDGLVMRSLATDRTERFERAGQMAEALDQLLLAMRVRVGSRELAAFLAQVCPPQDEVRPVEVTADTLPAISTTVGQPAQSGEHQSPPGEEQVPTLVGAPPAEGEQVLSAEISALRKPLVPWPESTAESPPATLAHRLRRRRALALTLGGLLALTVGGAALLVARGGLLAQTPPETPTLGAPISTVEPTTPATAPPQVAPVSPEPEPAQPPTPEPPAPQPDPARPDSPRPTGPGAGPVGVRPARPARQAGPSTLVLKAYLNVRSDRPAEAFIDGVSAGRTPLSRVLKPGRHELRVDCLFPTGRVQGAKRPINLPPEQDTDIEHRCVAEP